MTSQPPPPATTKSAADDRAAPRRLAHQMAIDAGLAVDSPLLRAFDEAARAADEEERSALHLKALHRMVDEAFEHQVKTMCATPESFQRLVLEAAQPAGGHLAH